MNDNFFYAASEENLQDIFTSQIKQHLDNLKRNCSSLSDEQFINSDINCIISQSKTGRGFLQKSDEIFNIPIPKSTFFEIRGQRQYCSARFCCARILGFIELFFSYF